MRKTILFFALAFAATAAQGQLPGLRKYPSAPPPAAAPLTGIDALRADFLAHAGADTIYFGSNSAILGAQAKATLQAQALWLRQHPSVAARIDGHADASDTRDHALAIGARRAEEVRDFLVLMGVPAAQLSVMSWGKERPGPPRAITVLMQ
jgi:peptidoglycan-associated lipoprotein